MMEYRTKVPPLDCSDTALFLDFDGTLVDIAPTPDAVVLPADLGLLLCRLEEATGGALAIVSGRSLNELEGFLRGFDGVMVGSHGSEARGMTPPLETLPEGLEAAQTEMRDYAASRGLLYEHKSMGAAIHFRNRPDAGPEVRAFIDRLAITNPRFEVQPAKMAYELRPAGFSKDGALQLLSDLPAFLGRRPVYIGDDTTDEPALDWAETHGGFGIKVGEGASCASQRLPDPAAVLEWLRAGGAR
ncbi:trehalose-phosphatase [Thioclava sp. GXIMD4216]|uniref:trehalose-phosphatase n=1 Tax=Thioclava sp. GXIMD4216 TaxID=3131929 RepID=UPI0030D05437